MFTYNADVIRAKRRSLKYTQMTVSIITARKYPKAKGVCPTTVQNVEQNKPCLIENVVMVANALGVTLEELFNET
jgi:hypothetical protein